MYECAVQVNAWSQHTTARFTEVWLDSQGHNYIAECPHGLIAMLRMELGPMSVPRPKLPPAAAAAAAADATGQNVAAGAAAADNKQPDKPSFLRRCFCCAA